MEKVEVQKPLSELVVEANEDGNPCNRDFLIEAYKEHAEQIAREYAFFGVDMEDLVQAAYEGLIRGVDHCISVKLKNVSKTILNSIRISVMSEISRYLSISLERKTSHNTPLTTVMVLAASKFLKEKHKYEHEPTAMEISYYIGRSFETVEEILKSGGFYRQESLDDPECEIQVPSMIEGTDIGDIFEYLDMLIDALNDRGICLSKMEMAYIECLKRGIIDDQDVAEELGNSYKAVSMVKLSLRKKLRSVRDLANFVSKEQASDEAISYEKSFMMRRKRDRANNRYRY